MSISAIQKRSGMGLDRSGMIAALKSQNVITPAAAGQTGDEKALVRVSGAFRSEQDVMGGYAVATVLAIVFLPPLCMIWLRIERPQKRHELEATCPSMPLPS